MAFLVLLQHIVKGKLPKSTWLGLVTDNVLMTLSFVSGLGDSVGYATCMSIVIELNDGALVSSIFMILEKLPGDLLLNVKPKEPHSLGRASPANFDSCTSKFANY